jgi:hypothetical protein
MLCYIGLLMGEEAAMLLSSAIRAANGNGTSHGQEGSENHCLLV